MGCGCNSNKEVNKGAYQERQTSSYNRIKEKIKTVWENTHQVEQQPLIIKRINKNKK